MLKPEALEFCGWQFVGFSRGEHAFRQAVFQVEQADHFALYDHRQAEDGTQAQSLDFRAVLKIAVCTGIAQHHLLLGTFEHS